MAGIYSALGELDRIRKMAGRRVKDLVTDPLGVLTQQADDLRNTQRGVEPVINPAGAGMRPIPREEQVSRMTEQSLDTLGGGLGMLGHTVFHGSPRAFSKFDKAKMGTGEWGGRAPTEFEARHAAAQRNAALPVEQGGLGLPPNNTAMDRARAMGFDTPAYHATLADVDKFKKNKVTAYGDRFFFSPDANYANEFAPLDSTIAGHTDKVKAWKEKNAGGAGQNIMPVMLKSEAMKDWTHISPEYVVKDPSAIRSRFAAFDPMKRHDADMLGFASPQLLGGMGLGGAGMAAYGLQDDQEGIFSRLGQYLRQRGMQ